MSKSKGRDEVFQSVDALLAALIPDYGEKEVTHEPFDSKSIADLLRGARSSSQKRHDRRSDVSKRTRRGKLT